MKRLGDNPEVGPLKLGGPGVTLRGGGSAASGVGATVLKRIASGGSSLSPARVTPGVTGGGGRGGGKPIER